MFYVVFVLVCCVCDGQLSELSCSGHFWQIEGLSYGEIFTWWWLIMSETVLFVCVSVTFVTCCLLCFSNSLLCT